MNSQICAVLVYVPDVPAALDWYQSAFRGAERRFLDEFNLTHLEFNGIRLAIVPADAPVYVQPAVVINPGWYGDRYYDGHRYWERREWEERHRDVREWHDARAHYDGHHGDWGHDHDGGGPRGDWHRDHGDGDERHDH
jgi:hypothetical protein